MNSNTDLLAKYKLPSHRFLWEDSSTCRRMDAYCMEMAELRCGWKFLGWTNTSETNFPGTGGVILMFENEKMRIEKIWKHFGPITLEAVIAKLSGTLA